MLWGKRKNSFGGRTLLLEESYWWTNQIVEPKYAIAEPVEIPVLWVRRKNPIPRTYYGIFFLNGETLDCYGKRFVFS